MRARRTVTAPALVSDGRDAAWIDRAVVVDEILITSRKPDDLPAFIGAIVEHLPTTARR